MATWHQYGINRLIKSLIGRLDKSCGRIRLSLLRSGARRCKKEHLQLDVARQPNDQIILKQMALEAMQKDTREQAASLINHPALLTAIALSTWDIEQGLKVVDRIRHPMLLRRLAHSARQDAIRLAAAGKLGNTRILKQIARSTADISLRWKAAKDLNDPDLMAEVALFKPANPRFDDLRGKALKALRDCLDDFGQRKDANALLAFILFQTHLPFQLEAFLHLPAQNIDKALLQHMAHRKFRFIPRDMIRKMLFKIEAAGWQLLNSESFYPCVHCKGRGTLSLKIIVAGRFAYESETVSCPDCDGIGRLTFFVVACKDRNDQVVELKLPPLAAEERVSL